MSAYGQAVAQLPRGLPVLINLADPLHALAAFYGILAQGRPCGIGDDRIAASAPPGTFHVLDTQLPPHDPRDMPVSPQPSLFITFTGGTTGTPKAILRDQSSWLYSFARQGIVPNDRVAVLGALSHSLALYATVEALHQMADVYLLSGLRPRAQLDAIRGHDVTVLYATPTQLKLLGGSPPLRGCSSAAARLTLRRERRPKRCFPMPGSSCSTAQAKQVSSRFPTPKPLRGQSARPIPA